MRAVVQRVLEAKVTVDGDIVGAIGPGLLIFIGTHTKDDDAIIEWMAKKCAQLRIFADAEGKMNRSLLDTGFDALVVSQFTLYGDARKGNRPSFIEAASPEIAEPVIQRFTEMLAKTLSRSVPTGRFRADMKVSLVNDGPVTLVLEREPN